MNHIHLRVLSVSVVITLLSVCPALAERFLTVEQALQVCFPHAERFEAITLKLSAEEIKAIERESKQKVRKNEVKLWVAHPGGVLIVDQVIGKHDFIDYAVAIATNGAVLQVEILEYREHYGGQVRQPKWREQFKGKTARDALKVGGDIYNISGATLSCRHVTDGVKRVLATFELVVRPRLLSGDGVRAPK
jgi:Na+-translocating ferredoxin:NAD+ oxidoreductase RnfG subunit